MLTLASTLVDVSRLQFALTIAFHFTFPAVTVGLSIFLTVVYWRYLRTGDLVYLRMYRLWRKIFAVGFGLGVVAGIVITFELGLNWGIYANAVGPIVGVIIAMEVITAFFLEAGFLGIMLYGEGRVSPRIVFFSTLMVSIGTLLSTTWIIAANSWMQTPAGYRRVHGQFQPTNWLHAIVNPSFPWRFSHLLVGVLIAASWMLVGVSAWYLIKDRHLDLARRTVSLGLGTLVMLMPVQIYIGDQVAGLMGRHQPPKIQALEGNWNSTNTGYQIFVIPSQSRQRNLFEIGIPKLGSIINDKDYSLKGTVPGLKQTPRDRQPTMLWTFYGFRTMFFGGLLLFATAFVGLVQRVRGRLWTARGYHRWLLWLTPLGVIVAIGGWVTAETGRQPWVVYGQLRTVDAVSGLAPAAVIASVIVFTCVYLGMFTAYVRTVARVVRKGPDAETPMAAPRPAADTVAQPVVVTR